MLSSPRLIIYKSKNLVAKVLEILNSPGLGGSYIVFEIGRVSIENLSAEAGKRGILNLKPHGFLIKYGRNKVLIPYRVASSVWVSKNKKIFFNKLRRTYLLILKMFNLTKN